MIGNKTRDLMPEERNAVGIGSLEHDSLIRLRSKAGACTAGSADAAHRGGMRRTARAAAGVMMAAVAVFVHVLFGNGCAPMTGFTERHQHACIAAQRERRKQQHEYQGFDGPTHSRNTIMGSCGGRRMKSILMAGLLALAQQPAEGED